MKTRLKIALEGMLEVDSFLSEENNSWCNHIKVLKYRTRDRMGQSLHCQSRLPSSLHLLPCLESSLSDTKGRACGRG